MATDVGSRYQHLLQPIRDLSKVWNIEIADELEKYIDEVSSLSFQSEVGSRKFNFAEAALLIQGSTAIYSRKVEQLYALVYQALDRCQIFGGQEKGPDGQAKKRWERLHAGLVAPIPETDELLTIDHLIKEGRNITLDDTALRRHEQRQLLYRRLPLFLMPRDKTEGKQEFRIGSCTVHKSGAYLLQEADARLLDESLTSDVAERCDEQHSPLAPPPPQEVRDLDERLQELLRGLPGSEPPGLPESPPFTDEKAAQPPDGDLPAEAIDVSLSDMLLPPPAAGKPRSDPWALLDEDEVCGTEAPLEVANCTKRLGNKRLLSTGHGLPERGKWEPLSDADLWRPGRAADGLPGLLAYGNPADAIFLAVARHLRSGGRSEVQKAGFSAAWLEFEDLFEAAAARRRHGRSKAFLRAKGAAPNTPTQALMHGGNSDDDGEPRTPPRCGIDMFQVTPLKADAVEPIEEDSRLQEQRLEVAKLEGMIEDAQSQYETSIRNQLQQLQGGADVSGKYPELYENVRRWQEQLKPVLKEFESHPEFEIHGYREKILAKMVALEKHRPELADDSGIPFARLVHGQPPWEVCRRFLTCLILTNQGNTEISFESEAARLNNFQVKLLETEIKPMAPRDDKQELPVPLLDTECADVSAAEDVFPAKTQRPAKRAKLSR
jgi:condensin-2 complex subunit H2